MKTHTSQRGFAIVAVLLVVATLAVFGATWSRHALQEATSSRAFEPAQVRREAAISSLSVAQQAGVMDLAISTMAIPGEKAAEVQLAELADDRMRCDAVALDGEGMGARLLVESGRAHVGPGVFPHPDDLPHIEADKLDAILADSSIPRHVVAGPTTLSGVDLEGLLIVADGVTLTLDDVTLRGCIVSAAALSHSPPGDHDFSGPAVVVTGGLRVDPAPFLPGVAVLMPDGTLSTSGSDFGVQLGGDVVAWSLELDVKGAVVGNVGTVDVQYLGPDMQRPGFGRMPTEWADDLDMDGAWETRFVGILPRFATSGQLAAITGYWQAP